MRIEHAYQKVGSTNLNINMLTLGKSVSKHSTKAYTANATGGHQRMSVNGVMQLSANTLLSSCCTALDRILARIQYRPTWSAVHFSVQ